MGKIFWGFMLLFLDFNINIDACSIGLIPDFIGYILLLKGIDELSQETDYFARYRGLAIAKIVYSVITYVLDLMGVSGEFQSNEQWMLVALINGVGLVMHIMLSRGIVYGIVELERKYNTNINAASLSSIWLADMWMSVISYILGLVLFEASELIVFVMIAAFVIHIIFLVQLNKSKNLYQLVTAN